ncbi:hypothetical protein R5R35_003566 [Gryllus longicercus]|uniref:Metalloendopeptidase OMA1, mitochondrial n=2 Tax=Gryllus longicercus TaxID=2509291 RepID=A0AAN9YY28_9ORTH
MLKLASRILLPFHQRPYMYYKVWSRTENPRSHCLQRTVANNCLCKVPSIKNGSFMSHNTFAAKVFFHTSNPKNALPPVLVILLRPLTKFLAIAFGRSIRMWWKRLPVVQRETYVRTLKQRKLLYLALLTPVPAGAVYFYIAHIEETPITKRKRFIAFSNEQVLQLAEIEQKVITDEHERSILPAAHPAYCRVLRVVSRLLDSNKDVEGINEHLWRIIVVDDKDIANAFVLPNGTIFIYTGMLEMCTNDNQLSIVLAHEMSHTILGHTAERMSHAQLVECLLFVPVVIIWAILPDLGAMLTQWFSGVLTKMLLHLPFSRQAEMEADDVGLTLAAKACFDIREAPCFWKKMKAMTSDGLDDLEWLSTHPSYDTRQIVLNELIPSALQLRETCQCPKLSSQDPRHSIDTVIQMITQNRRIKKHEPLKA